MDIFAFYPIILAFCRFFVGVIFLISALPKLRNPLVFVSFVQSYHLIPKSWVNPSANIIAAFELVLGLVLLTGWQTRLAALASAALLLVFLAAMKINLARGRKDLDCGCSGKKHAQKISWKTIARNVFLILLSLPVAIWGGGFLALDNQSPAVQEFVIEQVILNILLPLAFSSVGLVLLSRLLRQTVRLVMLIPVENQTSAVSETFRNLKTKQMEGSS